MDVASWELGEGDEGIWRDEICDRLLAADAPPMGAPRLHANVGMSVLAPVVALDLDVTAGQLALARGPRRIAHETLPEAFGLTLVTQGTAELDSPAGPRGLRAGDVCLLHSAVPFEKRVTAGYRETFLYLPRPFVDGTAGTRVRDPVPALAPPTGLGGLLADTLAAFGRRRRELAELEWRPLLQALVQLMVAVFLDGDRERAANPARALQRDRALRYIDAHLADPELSPRRIAVALGMSVRYLHLLFEGAGDSVAATILARRLDRCRAALTASPHRSICEVAFAWGFADAGHFSRAFKTRFGKTPRDARAA